MTNSTATIETYENTKAKHKPYSNSEHLKKREKNRHRIPETDSGICIILSLGIMQFSVLFITINKKTIRSTPPVRSYRSKVEPEAANYDMSDYVDLILALMMQESSGQGTDVMQSSEGAYNTTISTVA